MKQLNVNPMWTQRLRLLAKQQEVNDAYQAEEDTRSSVLSCLAALDELLNRKTVPTPGIILQVLHNYGGSPGYSYRVAISCLSALDERRQKRDWKGPLEQQRVKMGDLLKAATKRMNELKIDHELASCTLGDEEIREAKTMKKRAINHGAYEAQQATVNPDFFLIAQPVTIERVRDLLTTAFETTPWALVQETKASEDAASTTWHQTSKAEGFLPYSYLPCMAGSNVIVQDQHEQTREPIVLDAMAIAKGLVLMVQNHPQHWADFVTENDDAITGDVFLQLCLFGEVVYG